MYKKMMKKKNKIGKFHVTRVMHVSIEFWFWCSLNLESEKRRENRYGIENDDGGEENSEAIGVKMEKGDYCNCIVATDLATYCSPI